MKKKILAVGLAAVMAAGMSMTTFAGTWETVGSDWKYKNDDGTYSTNGWQWIDGKSYYFSADGIMAKDTVIDGYTVNGDGQWTVDGSVQTQGAGQTASANGANHSEGYDPAHPLRNMIDTWNLRLTDTGLIGISGFNICKESFQALLTGQMDKYYMAPAGYSTNPATGSQVYISQEDYDEGVMIENALYSWFCNWLNGMDFEHMSEMERAKEIQKVMAQIKYEVETTGKTRYTYYRTLIEKRGMCAEAAMTACSLAKALGLKSAVDGVGNHAVYYIQVDGVAYFGQNSVLNLNSPTPDTVFFQ